MTFWQVLFGFLLALAIALLAWRAHALSNSGALAAALLGTVIFGLGGVGWTVLLLAFFISSSGLSRLFGRRKQAVAEKFSKGSQRDAGQVLANGGVAGLLVILHLLFPHQAWTWLAFAASLAAANADTWATELGVLSRRSPVLITSLRPVERGASGGVSLAGTLAALGGSALLALLALPFWPADVIFPAVSPLKLVALVMLAGLGGSLVDSLLGATLQVIYHCPKCNKETERHPLHLCGSATSYLRGWRWMDNDWVNTACTAAAALLAALAAGVF